MSNSLEERLKTNSNAFDGLLSLIPAKYYYDEETREQWKATKKSKIQSKIDKKRKLNPEEQNDSSFSALEVKKRREKDAKPVVLPGENLNRQRHAEEQEDEDVESEHISILFDDNGNEMPRDNDESEVDAEPEQKQDPEEQTSKSRVKSKDLTEEEKVAKKKKMEELRAKLQEKIQSMKERRKAPGTKVEGAPSSREAILAQRRHREEIRKRKLEEEKQKHDDSSDESGSESESDLEDQLPRKKAALDADVAVKDMMFQNIVFDDGSRSTSDLQRFRKAEQGRGPSKNDVKSHLKLAESKRAALENKDELQQIMIKQREKWKKAMLQAEGVKLKDDEKLLRKAVKRKEAKKRKSAVEWKEREQVVTNSIAEKQKRREENLAIRRENKGKKKSKQQKMKRKFTGTIVAKKRAGFEGRLKSGKKK
ncbi:HDR160Wp [Eremothecium sinecaudum]|uniref:HDR160Wp n=1 Tax=Eremothecium sinecaudum TaxID=45286 RepID=A0A0X8HSW4_9SACH|nr:HDR160Wp [Eremothecium sinecaudum]AMD20902.1 HDR160Wp [Eremothecium sinecaudum]